MEILENLICPLETDKTSNLLSNKYLDLTWVKYHSAAKGGEQVQYYKREDGVNSKIQIFIFSLQIILLGRQ